jgi:hypothetical protein
MVNAFRQTTNDRLSDMRPHNRDPLARLFGQKEHLMDVTAHYTVQMRLSERELRIVSKALGLAAGLKVSISGEDRESAATLNTELLRLRRQQLVDQMAILDKAIEKDEGKDGRAAFSKPGGPNDRTDGH